MTHRHKDTARLWWFGILRAKGTQGLGKMDEAHLKQGPAEGCGKWVWYEQMGWEEGTRIGHKWGKNTIYWPRRGNGNQSGWEDKLNPRRLSLPLLSAWSTADPAFAHTKRATWSPSSQHLAHDVILNLCMSGDCCGSGIHRNIYFLKLFSSEVYFKCPVLIDKNCLLLKSGKWKIGQDCPPESHVSLPIGAMSLASWNSHSVSRQSGT